MLKVDSNIKNLFAKFGVRRNFRVMFPNGERADLTNADIVTETVELSESVCSETVFRFGCVERSMLTFECMGVENIQGCQIICALEIDTSSLPASTISLIQTWIEFGYDDGEIVLEADSDLGYGYYRIPYGMFWVESCPRDQSNRKRRKVTAYSADINKVSPVERVRLATYVPSHDTFTTFPYQLAAVNAGWILPGLFSAWRLRRNTSSNYNYYTWANFQSVAAAESHTFSVTADGHTYSVTIAGTYALEDYSERMGGASNVGELGQINLSGWDTDAAWEAYRAFFAQSGVSEPTVAAHTRLPRTYLQPHLTYDKDDQYGVGQYDHAPIYWLPDYGCPCCMLAFRERELKANSAVRVMWDLTLTFQIDGATVDTQTFFPAANVEASVYMIDSTGFSFNVQSRMVYKATNKYISNGTTFYSYMDSYKSDAALAPYLELYARQVRVDRWGIPQIIRFDNSSPSPVSADSIESIFWEDSEISPIGEADSRRADPNSTDPEDMIICTDYVGNDGRSIYKMLNNSYIMAFNYASSPLVSDFIPWLPQSEFIPFEAVVHDMPWMQPGDAIQLATADEDTPTLNTIILTQRISGVKSLRQEIAANGGATFFENNAYIDGVAAIYGDQNASL
jgi:hypothetical protein